MALFVLLFGSNVLTQRSTIFPAKEAPVRILMSSTHAPQTKPNDFEALKNLWIKVGV